MKKSWIKNKNLLFGLIAAAALCQTGCGGSKDTMALDSSAAQTAMNDSGDIYLQEFDEAAGVMEEEAAEEGTALVSANRKLIKEVYMDVETGDFDTLLSKVEGRVEALGGYIESMNVYNGGRNIKSLKNAGMTIRIPKEKLDQFVTEVSEYSNVVNRSEDTRDVTMQYVDLESHKKALRTEQDRLLELLEKAESMEDIIAIEERLSQIRYETESMESQLRTYDNLVDFSTIRLNISEVEELTPTGEETAAERMAKGFASSARSLAKGIKNTLIWLVICLPYFLFIACIAGLLIFFIRASKKRKLKKLSGKGEDVES